jgi:hypothetical protein
VPVILYFFLGNAIYDAYIENSLTDKDDADGIIKQYDIKWALLRPGEPIVFMLETQGWVQIYRDDTAIVLANRQ